MDEVERVARALHKAFTPYADYSYPWRHSLASRPMFLDLARAAIAALREPDLPIYKLVSGGESASVVKDNTIYRGKPEGEKNG